jgi:HSP20 family protein
MHANWNWGTLFGDLDSLFIPPVSGASYTYNVGKDGLVITMEIPGVPRSDLSLDVEGRTLTVSGERKGTLSKKYRERFFVKNGYDLDKADAQLVDGILTITIPRAEDSSIKRIPIKATT